MCIWKLLLRIESCVVHQDCEVQRYLAIANPSFTYQYVACSHVGLKDQLEATHLPHEKGESATCPPRPCASCHHRLRSYNIRSFQYHRRFNSAHYCPFLMTTHASAAGSPCAVVGREESWEELKKMPWRT